MDEAQATRHPYTVCSTVPVHVNCRIAQLAPSILNTFKTMVMDDDDVLDNEDYFIFERIREFVMDKRIEHLAAAKQTLVWIDRTVRILLLVLCRPVQLTRPNSKPARGSCSVLWS